MAKVLYFDPFNGISGDMILGALIDLGLPPDHLRRELAKLNLQEDYRLESRRIGRQGLFGQDFKVIVSQPGHHHRHYSDIRRLIEESELEDWVRRTALAIFKRLGEAEAKVHGSSLEKVHFHEVGAVDSIVDIVGVCIGFRYLEVERFYTAAVNLGHGTVRFSHGNWPVPAPATAELMRGLEAYPGETAAEMTTPTGAAVLAELVERAPMPRVRMGPSGYGAGDREFDDIPNMLRVILAETIDERTSADRVPDWEEDQVAVLQANLDDMDGQLCGHVLELALEQGALDVFYTPVHMKKSRPGLLLTLLCRPQDQQRMTDLLLRETSTLGVRHQRMQRSILRRQVRQVDTPWGPLGLKIARRGDKVVNIAAEFDDLRRLARQQGVPLKVLSRKLGRLLQEFEEADDSSADE
ncbi:MAG TPA: nickel pincer cofactor biosynthesis protein LarC [Acidobacteriota bacterium]|nr:nickel pincer cofactor biosynthesis protein LarC [Acidobacteriota bacterium]